MTCSFADGSKTPEKQQYTFLPLKNLKVYTQLFRKNKSPNLPKTVLVAFSVASSCHLALVSGFTLSRPEGVFDWPKPFSMPAFGLGRGP